MANENETEADTRANRIDPVLKNAGWGVIEGSKVKREVICPGRIQPGGRRGKIKRCDYVLIYRGHKLAALEAKPAGSSHRDGIAQVKDYAERLDTPMAFSSNGIDWYQINMTTGSEGEMEGDFPSPQQLWDMKFTDHYEWRDRFADVPFEDDGGKWQPRYYIVRAIDAALESIAKGNRRILLTLATGTGKTSIAFHISWKLFQSKWNLSGEPSRPPRILFLADRNILADQAFNTFSAFPEGSVVRIDPETIRKRGSVPKNAHVFFTIFQTFTTGETDFAYEQYRPDFFDFIIIDECHRGGANDESQWRAILEHFQPAVQLGLTATPKRKYNADTYAYFGEPVYTYSLKDGIEDGYLTPFRVRQMASTIDEYVYNPVDDVVRGEVEAGDRFTEDQINHKIIIQAREESRVREFLSEVDQSQKAIVFCATQYHAAMVRDIINQNKDSSDPNYCHRVTAEDGKLGEQHLRDFQDNEKVIPTILTTSQKLSTGVDARNIRHIVLMRPVRSMIEFKQIIGRGTRVHDGKDHFTIWDFVRAHENFNDADWDGPPDEPVPPRPTPPRPPGPPKPPPPEVIVVKLSDETKRSIRYLKATTYWDADGKPISAKVFVQRLFGGLSELIPDEDTLRRVWSNPDTRKTFLMQLEERGFDENRLEEVKHLVEAPMSDLFDVLSFILFETPMKTRLERSADASFPRKVGTHPQSSTPIYTGRDRIGSYIYCNGQTRVLEDHEDAYSIGINRSIDLLANAPERQEPDWPEKQSGEMKEFLQRILSAYVDQGERELSTDSLGNFILARYGSVSEGKERLGDLDQVKAAFKELQAAIYAF